jgi:hypothetical protein
LILKLCNSFFKLLDPEHLKFEHSHDCRRSQGNVFFGQTEGEELFVEFVCHRRQHNEFVCYLSKETAEEGATL